MFVIVRPGRPSDFEQLMGFYTRERSDSLPTPTAKDLATALADGWFVIVESEDGQILASAAQIPLTPVKCHTFVGELTGTRVTPALNRGKPINFQTLLLGLRVLQHAALLGEVIAPATSSLVTIVKKENVGSLKNVRRAKFIDCPERPAWLRFDELSWHGEHAVDEWEYFRATQETVRHLAHELISNGLLDQTMELQTQSGATKVSIHGFRDLWLAADDLSDIALGRRAVELAPLPVRLVFHPEASADDVVQEVHRSAAGDAVYQSEIAWIFQEICTHLEPFRRGEQPITLDTVIADDLNIDPLAIMDMVMELEDRFDISIPMNVVAKILTVRQLADTISELRRW